MAKLTPDQLKKAHQDLKKEARQRIAERGVLQFRADPETVIAVLEAADKAKMPVGKMLRLWVQEKLILQAAEDKAPDLVKRLCVLEETVSYLQKKIK